MTEAFKEINQMNSEESAKKCKDALSDLCQKCMQDTLKYVAPGGYEKYRSNMDLVIWKYKALTNKGPEVA